MSRTPNHSRGVAMLLVLISMMTATVLTMAYLASRDNSALIGQNVASASTARWTSEAGLDTAMAILQTQADWRTTHTSGKLLDNYAIAGGTIDINVLDLITNLPPTAASEHIEVTVTAVINGVEQKAVAIAHVPVSVLPVASVDLTDFAVFTSGPMTFENDAILARWPRSPLYRLGKRVAIGTQATTAGSVRFLNESRAVDTTLYHDDGASSSLVTSGATNGVVASALTDVIPMPAAPSSGVAHGLGIGLPYILNSGAQTISANSRLNGAHIGGNATLTISGNRTIIVDGDLEMDGAAAKIVINGNVVLAVRNDLEMDEASIELRPNASLRLFVCGDFEMDDSFIGELRASDVRDSSGDAVWIDPRKIAIYSVSTGSNPDWRFRGRSVIKGNIYAPNVDDLDLEDESAIYGRIAARTITVSGDSAVFYDSLLDTGVGYTNSKSPIFDTDRRIKASVRSLASLTTTTVQTLADALDVSIINNGAKIVADAHVSPPASPAPAADEPSPRPTKITFEIVSLGTPVYTWEDAVP